ncbi:anhydro-N-acetylmuramic acid kinase [Marinospirillum perlucidum]|uniref:anhydro-N-acetylmuramic acid kinase n=1 Tax=Marinospirillum perlucidum TaxID=1982602 RepID=UPI001FE3B543|nr:anhydro-N-acetylmuramic acid kinase [Marinospirillum perlucidum]
MANSSIFGGMMSGTSLDGVDGVLAQFGHNQHLELIAKASRPFSEDLRNLLLHLAHADQVSFADLARAEKELTHCYADCWSLLSEQLPAVQVSALGCHGQTLEHRPESGYSLQLLDPSLLAELTGQTIICDFRRRDLAAGGQGAPLAPAFHQAFFSMPGQDSCFINLGGIANLTWLPADPQSPCLGFDTGPANLLLDAWTQRHLGQNFDPGGNWASQHQPDEQLLQQLLQDEYFARLPPKSTGREKFNLDWLDGHLTSQHQGSLEPGCIQATLVELTTRSLVQAIEKLDPEQRAEIFVGGGGCSNNYLMQRLAEQLAPRSCQASSAKGVHPQDIEALAFAWLAKEFMNGGAGNLPEVTGASGKRRLGGYYPAR